MESPFFTDNAPFSTPPCTFSPEFCASLEAEVGSRRDVQPPIIATDADAQGQERAMFPDFEACEQEQVPFLSSSSTTTTGSDPEPSTPPGLNITRRSLARVRKAAKSASPPPSEHNSPAPPIEFTPSPSPAIPDSILPTHTVSSIPSTSKSRPRLSVIPEETMEALMSSTSLVDMPRVSHSLFVSNGSVADNPV